MRKALTAMIGTGILAVGLVSAASLHPSSPAPSRERCASDIAAMHGVWVSPQSFLPVYGDWELMAYLASVKGPNAAVPVMPVFTAEPVLLRSARVIFVSTGFILKAGSEKELADAIRDAPVSVLSRDLPACTAMAPAEPAGLPEMQQRLADQLAGYQDMTRRRLRTRGAESPTSGAGTSPRSAPDSTTPPRP